MTDSTFHHAQNLATQWFGLPYANEKQVEGLVHQYIMDLEHRSEAKEFFREARKQANLQMARTDHGGLDREQSFHWLMAALGKQETLYW